MTIRNPRSIIIIFVYFLMNALIVFISWQMRPEKNSGAKIAKELAPEYTEIFKLDYFHLKDGIPQMSLAAEKMRSQGQELAEFEVPRGVYNYQQKKKTIKYSALTGVYKKKKDLLTMKGDVRVSSEEADYSADKIRYYFKKDLVIGIGNVRFEGDDLKSHDHMIITSDRMRARPEAQLSTFSSNVQGSMERKKKYEGKMTFSSALLNFDGTTSVAHLEGEVKMHRENYDISAGKADMHLDNFNKNLKYFVLNDDVKVSEKVQTKEGPLERKSFSERLEGFGREQKMVLSGAPRVEMGKDVIKGYRITIRENSDFVEVEDAVSDMQVKRKKAKD